MSMIGPQKKPLLPQLEIAERKILFDIRQFLSFHNIPVREKGRNVGKNNINVCCPFCIKSGRGDEDFHMGIHLGSLMYGCWRESIHRGRKIERLLVALIGCSWGEAEKLVHGTVTIADDVISFKEWSQTLWIDEPKNLEKSLKNEKRILIFPKDFVNISFSNLTAKFFWYLESRGFNDIPSLIKKYDLRCCLSGAWKNRVIIPLFFEGDLVSWTGRSIYDNAFLRYQDLSVEESIIHPKQFLFNYDNLQKGGEVLFVCEGPFDAIKLDYYLPFTHRATCLFTKSMTSTQFNLLTTLGRAFTKIKILLDEDALGSSMDISGELTFLKNVEFFLLPDNMKDPGALSEEQVLGLV